MDNLTRRRFLGWTTAGAAGAGLLAVLPRLASSSTSSAATASRPTTASGSQPAAVLAPAAASPSAWSDPVVAYVHNASSGDLSLMVGTTEVTLHDPDLVARLFQRAGKAN